MAIVPHASPAALYVKARAAEAAGDTAVVHASFSALTALEPSNTLIATRAYRAAVSAGDMPLALRTAHQLDRIGGLPPDGRVLLALEAVRAGDWAAARLASRKLAQDKAFGFLAVYFDAWIAEGAHAGDPLTIVGAARESSLAAPYLLEQRALLLVALGRQDEARALVGAQAAPRLPERVTGPSAGLAALLGHLASDFGQQQLAPVALILARMATYAAPEDPRTWLLTASLLGVLKRPDLGLAALDHVPADGDQASAVNARRIALLSDSGRTEAALAAATKATDHAGAGQSDWARVGDLQMILSHPGEAAQAYGQAVAAAVAAKAPAATLVPLLLQQANALDLAGEWPEARAALQRAYALAPGEALVLNQYGYAQIAHRENVAEASALIAQAARLQPDDPAITDSLGWAFYLRGDAAGALPLLEKATAGAPSEAAISEHLGDAYWSVGRRYEARYAWRAALMTAEEKDRTRLSSKIDLGLTPATAAP